MLSVLQRLVIAATLGVMGCASTPPDTGPGPLEWNAEDGLRVTLARALRVGEPLKIGQVAEPCEIDNYLGVNDVREFAGVEYSPGEETWTIVMTHSHGAALPAETVVTHKLLSLNEPGTFVQPTSAWLQLGETIEARREW